MFIKWRCHVFASMFLFLLAFFLWFEYYELTTFYRNPKRISPEAITSTFLQMIGDRDALTNQTSFKGPSIEIDNCSSLCFPPKDRVMFLKTHKTGGSTITNILNRYGNKNNLTFALPKNEITFNWPSRLKCDFVVNTWTRPHILCNHARYNKPTLHHLFPKHQSTYITILREPFAHYESTFNYFKLWDKLGIEGENNMEILEKYLRRSFPSVKHAKLNLSRRYRLLRNPMLYDLGLDFRYYQDKDEVRKYIEFLENEFDLVMLMEYFNESVVLLKRIMCWDFDDVVFVRHNERQEKDKKKISLSLQENIRSWNQADFILYDHFNKTLWKKIAAEGPDFYKDLAQFHKRQKEVFDMCIGPSSVITEIYVGKFVQGHSLKKDIPQNEKLFCSNLVKSELVFHQENLANHRKRQEEIDSWGRFENEFDKENDWAGSRDFVHNPAYQINKTGH